MIQNSEEQDEENTSSSDKNINNLNLKSKI